MIGCFSASLELVEVALAVKTYTASNLSIFTPVPGMGEVHARRVWTRTAAHVRMTRIFAASNTLIIAEQLGILQVYWASNSSSKTTAVRVWLHD